MSSRPSAFIDTSAFVALIDRRDSQHQAAIQIQRRLVREEWALFTSNLVLAEAHALILHRVNRRSAGGFLDSVREWSAGTLWVDEKIHDLALDILRRYQDKDFSLTDATSFAIMERLGIRYAFSFDADFLRYGFSILT